MAFRHYQGTPPVKSVIWKCPTCGSENAGLLEAGCVQCKAGADAQKAVAKGGKATLPRGTGRSPFEQWAEATYANNLDSAGWSIASAAWDAGVAWATGNREPLPPPLLAASAQPQGGWAVALVDPNTKVAGLTDSRTEQTILAALAFYRDNQLAYGAVPGQLDAQEVSALIEKLSPQEVEA